MSGDYGDRILERRQRAQVGQDAARRMRWTARIEDKVALLENRVRRLARDMDLAPAEVRDDIDAARHYHDRRIDEIWLVLVQAGLLPTHELHHTIRDNSDVGGRVEGCDHCAEALARHPFEGSVSDRIDAERDRAHAEMGDFWGEDEE